MKNKKLMLVSITFLLIVLIQLTPLQAWAITWSADTPLITNENFRDINPSITQTADGKILVVYSSNKEDWSGEIYYVTYDGSSWSTEQRLTDNPRADDLPAVTRTQDDTIWVVWTTGRDIDNNLYYKTSTDNGTSWSPATPLVWDPNNDRSPSITQSLDGTIWVVWTSNRIGDPVANFEIFYKTYDGFTWSPETQLTNNASGDFRPSVFATRDGKIWVVWSSIRTGNYEIFYKIYNGSSWSPATQLTYDPDSDRKPSVFQARDGALWIVWQSDRQGNQFDIYYTITPDYGASWSPAPADNARLTTGSEDDIAPSIFNTEDGKMWLVWSKYPATDYDIYYKTSDAIPIHDVAVTSIATNSTLVYQGEIIEINVTAENQGTEQETFNVTCYANSTQIGNRTVTLTAGASTTLTFNWDTTDFKRGNYVISATASTVTDETLPNQEDNTLSNGTVRVKLLGDVNDDGIVNVIDLATIGRSYGTSVGDPLYDPEADINRDGIIDIADLATAAYNYLKTG